MIIGKHMRQMKLNTKLLLGFTVPLVLIVAIAAVVYTHVGSLIETSKRVTHTHQSIEFGTALALDLINMETGLRGYLLTGKEDFLDPYKNGRKSFKESIFKAKKHVNDSPMQVKRLEKIEERYEEWIEQWVAPGIDQRKRVKKGVGGMGRIISRVQTAGSKSYMEGMRAALNEFIAAERVFIKSRNMQMEATANLTTNVTVFGAMAAVLLGAILTFFITRNILRQLGRDPALVVRIAERIASGDLTEKLEVDAKEGTNLYVSLKAMQDKLTAVIGETQSAAIVVQEGSEGISRGNENISQRTAEQASSLEETASAMEEMTATVKQNADNAKQASHLAIAAREVAEKGGEVTSQSVAAMEEINKSSKKIGDIITVIDEIAFQTNLLALNAAVEAARAGEHGRGFAVVAAEVRNLAQRSATAAKEIKGLIGESMQKVSEGSALVNQCGKTLGEIVGSVKHVADIVSEISAASQEQSNGIDQVSKTLVAMNKSTQENAALVEEAASASEAMGQKARELTMKVAFFRLPDEALSALAAGEVPQVKDHPEGQGSGPRPGNRMVMRAKGEPVQPAPKAHQSKLENRAAGPDAGEQWQEF